MTKLSTKVISRVKFLTSNSIANYFSREPIYIFHHIPKCGGTSLMYALREWFQVVKDYKTTHLSKSISPRANIRKFRHFQCLSGHFHIPGLYLQERYPEALNDARYKIFTLLRDPLETKISTYYYDRKMKMEQKQMSLEEHLFSNANWLAARFPCNENDYKEVLSRYFFIGLLEHSQESMNRLADFMGKKRVTLPFENVTPRDHQAIGISAAMIEKFKQLNALDYKIYNYCYEKFCNPL